MNEKLVESKELFNSNYVDKPTITLIRVDDSLQSNDACIPCCNPDICDPTVSCNPELVCGPDVDD